MEISAKRSHRQAANCSTLGWMCLSFLGHHGSSHWSTGFFLLGEERLQTYRSTPVSIEVDEMCASFWDREIRRTDWQWTEIRKTWQSDTFLNLSKTWGFALCSLVAYHGWHHEAWHDHAWPMSRHLPNPRRVSSDIFMSTLLSKRCMEFFEFPLVQRFSWAITLQALSVGVPEIPTHIPSKCTSDCLQDRQPILCTKRRAFLASWMTCRESSNHPSGPPKIPVVYHASIEIWSCCNLIITILHGPRGNRTNESLLFQPQQKSQSLMVKKK